MHIECFSFMPPIFLFIFFHFNSSIDFLLLFIIPYRLDISLFSLFNLLYILLSNPLSSFHHQYLFPYNCNLSFSTYILYSFYTFSPLRYLPNLSKYRAGHLYVDLDFSVSLFHYIYISLLSPYIRSTFDFILF